MSECVKSGHTLALKLGKLGLNCKINRCSDGGIGGIGVLPTHDEIRLLFTNLLTYLLKDRLQRRQVRAYLTIVLKIFMGLLNVDPNLLFLLPHSPNSLYCLFCLLFEERTLPSSQIGQTCLELQNQ